ncbi:MAG TPA: hypothetical protein VF461_19475 [Gemmatimonadaceae bacterium]
MAEMDSLRELYVEELKDLWSAENQINMDAEEGDGAEPAKPRRARQRA